MIKIKQVIKMFHVKHPKDFFWHMFHVKQLIRNILIGQLQLRAMA